MCDSKQYEKLFSTYREKCKELGLVLLPPAKESDIQALADSLKVDLPKDIIDFYRFCNGFETHDFLFRILPINEILDYKHELETPSFYLAEYMIYSDTWKIEVKNPNEYYILNGNHGSHQQVILTNSIYTFIERYLMHEGIFGNSGLYEWLDAIKANN